MSARCRSCGAEVLWARSLASGNPIPLDAEPVPGGNIRLAGTDEHLGIAIVMTKQGALDAQADGETLYVTHFSTCPHAAEHRKK